MIVTLGRLDSWVISNLALNIATLCHALGHEFKPWWRFETDKIKEQKKNVFDNILEEKEMMLNRLMTILIKLLAFK